MKLIAAIALSFVVGASAHAQFVLPATMLTGIPAGDKQKVVLSGWQHCEQVGEMCKSGGSPQVFRFAGGENAYDREGNIFSPTYDGSSQNNITSLALLHFNGSLTQFAKVPTVKCTNVSSTSIVIEYQYLLSYSFNLVANALQIVTENLNVTYVPTDPTGTIECPNISLGTTTFTDQTNAYITITGPDL